VGLLHWIVSSNGMWLEPRHGALLEDASGPEPQRIQHDTHLWLFTAPSFSSSASASGHG
jgi:hypothetical protein